MAEFATVPLVNVARLLSGGTPSKTEPSFWSGSIPWLTPKDMGQWDGFTEETVSREAIGNGTRLAPEGAVYIAVRGMSLHNEIRVVRSDAALTFNQDIKAIVPKDGYDGRFLYYALTAKKPELLETVEAAGHGTGRLPTDRLESIRVPCISPANQTAIVSCLRAFDDKIELNRRMNETLEAMAQAIFKDWFVDFGPTRAKMEGGGAYLAPEIWGLFPDKLDDEGKPDGWEVLPLPEVFDFREGPGIRNWQYTNSDEGTRFINIRCIQGHDLNLKNANRVNSIEANGKYFHFHLREDDIVVSTSGTLGRWALVRKEHLPLLLNTSVIRFRPKKGISSLEYLRCYVDRPSFVNELEMRAVGSVQKNFGPVHLKQMAVTVPPAPVAEAFSVICGPLFALWKAHVCENEQLAKCCDLLLPKLISGEIRVTSAEKIAEAAL